MNAADYGFPQRRRRVFIVAEHLGCRQPTGGSPLPWLYEEGVPARALHIWPSEDVDEHLAPSRTWISLMHPSADHPRFGWINKVSPFQNAGVMSGRRDGPGRSSRTTTGSGDPRRLPRPRRRGSGGVLHPKSQIPQWEYLKGAKRGAGGGERPRVPLHGGGDFVPRSHEEPSRTILTGEGDSTPSRLQAYRAARRGRFRTPLPRELERLNGFGDGWTERDARWPPRLHDGECAGCWSRSQSRCCPVTRRITGWAFF